MNLSQAFKKISSIEPPAKLEGVILRRIELENRKQVERKLILSRIGLAGSFTAFLYAMFTLGSTLLNSEFWSIFSLAFSDMTIVASNWKTYLYSLGETLPVMNIIIVLIPILGLLMFFNLLVSLRRSRYFNSNINFRVLQH